MTTSPIRRSAISVQCIVVAQMPSVSLLLSERRIVDDEGAGDDAELAEQLAELGVLGVRQVRIAGRRAFERQHVDVREARFLPSGLLLTPSSNAVIPGIFFSQRAKGLGDLVDLLGSRARLVLEDDDMTDRLLLHGCLTGYENDEGCDNGRRHSAEHG